MDENRPKGGVSSGKGPGDTIALIEHMSERELLKTIIARPWYLTDPYYKNIAKAIQDRHTTIMSYGFI